MITKLHKCSCCEQQLPRDKFHRDKRRKEGLRAVCIPCGRLIRNEGYEVAKRFAKSGTLLRDGEKYFHTYALKKRHECKSKLKVPFDLDGPYLTSIAQEVCPVLGISLVYGARSGSPNDAELDRVVPERGYVKGNVAFISRRANRIKSDASVSELEAILDYMRQ